ncbi:hypothetical protein OIU78_025841 [Salix suchowensis]|nr:hypothetical protein OIU78_025841 [Salix suchowensis]
MGSLQHLLNRPISVPFSPNLKHRRSFFAHSCLNLDVHATDSVKPKTHLKSGEVMEMEGKVLVGTYARNPVVISSGKGCKLYDPEGREYLDCTSGIAVNALGHGDTDWVKAVVEQANLLTHVSNVFYSVPQVELARRLVACSFADRVFFSNSGTEANEAAYKVCTENQYRVKVVFIVQQRNSYSPYGVLVMMLGLFWFFDEVQCGLGRTGYLWAHEAYDVVPDIMTLAKPLAGGLPIGASLVSEKVAAAIKYGDHGSTFAGGPLVCNAAIAVLDKISKPDFLASVSKKGEYFKELIMHKLGGNPHVREVRGFGLIIGIELDVSASPLVDACRDSGLLILTAGKGNVVRLVPPLIISEQELERAAEIMLECLPALDKTN